MHANDLVGTVGDDSANFGDGNRGRVRGEDGVVGSRVCKPLKDQLLDFEIFIGGLDHEVGILERVDVTRVGDSIDHIAGVGLRETLLSNLFLAPVGSEGPALVKTALKGVNHGHVDAGNATCHDSDASAHLTCPNHSDVLHAG